MRFDVITIFPEFLEQAWQTSILGRALTAGKIECQAHNLRDWTTDKHHCTDDAPYGGGGGMVMLADPLLRCIRDVRRQAAEALVTTAETTLSPDHPTPRVPVVYLSPQGEVLNHQLVHELSQAPGLILLCGNYEGIDERVAELEVDREISIGDYVLTGGELGALVIINAVARHIEGVLGNPTSAARDSFENGLLDFPHYTRPEVIEDLRVPEILLSGHHAKIEQWRREQSLRRTFLRRPDLLQNVTLSKADRKFLASISDEKAGEAKALPTEELSPE